MLLCVVPVSSMFEVSVSKLPAATAAEPAKEKFNQAILVIHRALSVLTAGQSHQYSIWTSGRKQSSNLSAAQMNPASQGRFSIRNQGIVIAGGVSIQMRGSQLSDTAGAAEPTTVLMEYVAV